MLQTLNSALRAGVDASNTIKDAIIEPTAMATVISIFEHRPFFFTLVAIGLLAIFAPRILAGLGFAAKGIVKGSWAAIWQSRYLGLVPAGSLFSFLQRCGMVQGKAFGVTVIVAVTVMAGGLRSVCRWVGGLLG